MQLFRPILRTEEILEELRPVLNSGWIGLGGQTVLFEKAFAKYVGAKYAVAVNSCTAALHMALKAFDIEKGHRVATTPITFVSTNHVILYQGAEPYWIDVDENTMCMDPYELAKHIDQVSAIMVVHYGGNSADMDRIRQLARSSDIPIIEDCAHAAGAKYEDGRMIGNPAYEYSMCCFSFHAVKNLPIGDGGIITTNNSAVAERLKKLRWLGIDQDTYSRTATAKNKGYNWMYDVPVVGFKYHMNDITASIGLIQLKYLDDDNLIRRSLWDEYNMNLDPNICQLIQTKYGCGAHHLIAGMTPFGWRDKLIKYLNDYGIFPGVHYSPNHNYSVYTKYYQELPVAENEWPRLISLPVNLAMTNQDVKWICRMINNFLPEYD
ncbi:MAG: DegT/DnrJ/EryC1/StrS family aminotransferase [Candidatus Kariarchaeaceae archaeon]